MATTTGTMTATVLVATATWISNNETTTSFFEPAAFICPPAITFQSLLGPSPSTFWGAATTINAQTTSLLAPLTPLAIAPKTGTDYSFRCLFTFTEAETVQGSSFTPTGTIIGPPEPIKSKANGKTAALSPTGTGSSDLSVPILSTAAASGIGIGAFVLGILLGLVAAGGWLCSRQGRRPPNRHNRMTPNGEERSAMLLSGPPVPPPKDPTTTSPSSQAQSSPRVTPISAAAAIPHASSLGHANVFHSLQGANDDQVAKELEFMGDMIEEHVKNNYHLKRVNIDHNMLKESMGGLYLDESMRDQIAALAMEPHTRHAAIRHFLALSIFSALDVHSAHAVSLLPPGVSAFIRSLPCERPEDYSYSTLVLDTWRRASAYLLNNNTDKTSPLSPQEVGNSQIESFHAAVNRFLSHFAHEDKRAVFDQTKNLEGVIYECVVFGYSIFSHPCLWRYAYIQHHQSTSSDLEKTSLVVLPGLEKLTGRGGEVLAHPEVLVNPTIVSV